MASRIFQGGTMMLGYLFIDDDGFQDSSMPQSEWAPIKKEWLTDGNHMFREVNSDSVTTVTEYSVFNKHGVHVGFITKDEWPEDWKPRLLIKMPEETDYPPVVSKKPARFNRKEYKKQLLSCCVDMKKDRVFCSGSFIEGEISPYNTKDCRRSRLQRDYTFVDHDGRFCGSLYTDIVHPPSRWDYNFFSEHMHIKNDDDLDMPKIAEEEIKVKSSEGRSIDQNNPFKIRFYPFYVVHDSVSKTDIGVVYRSVDCCGKWCGYVFVKTGEAPMGWCVEDFYERVFR